MPNCRHPVLKMLTSDHCARTKSRGPRRQRWCFGNKMPSMKQGHSPGAYASVKSK